MAQSGQQQCQPQVDVAPASAAPAAADGDMAAEAPVDVLALAAAEEAFVRLVSSDISRFHERFLEREEMHVINLSLLEERLGSLGPSAPPAALLSCYRSLVDLHGQLLLLVHWGSLAHTGLLKILKKRLKRTGRPVDSAELDDLRGQFCAMQITWDLVHKTEAHLAELSHCLGLPPPPSAAAALAADATAAAEGGASAAGAAGGTPEHQQQHLAAANCTNGHAPASGVNVGSTEGSCVGRGNSPDGAGAAPAAPAAAAAAVHLGGLKRPHEPFNEEDRETEMVRRARAALGIWQQLQATASTPSTVVGPAPAGAEAAAMSQPPRSTSSVAEQV